MTQLTPADLERLLAHEFDRQGWQYELGLGKNLVVAAVDHGSVDGATLSALVPSEFFSRNCATREHLAAAIDRVAGGAPIAAEVVPPSIQITVQSGDSYTVDIGAGANFQNSPLNVGPGTQLQVNSQCTSGELTTVLGALVAAGLGGEWDQDAARAIGASIEEQGKLSLEEAKAAVLEAGKEIAPEASRIREFTEKVAVSGLGSFLTTAISLGLGDLLHLLG
jgi:hypothetical protein